MTSFIALEYWVKIAVRVAYLNWAIDGCHLHLLIELLPWSSSKNWDKDARWQPWPFCRSWTVSYPIPRTCICYRQRQSTMTSLMTSRRFSRRDRQWRMTLAAPSLTANAAYYRCSCYNHQPPSDRPRGTVSTISISRPQMCGYTIVLLSNCDSNPLSSTNC